METKTDRRSPTTVQPETTGRRSPTTDRPKIKINLCGALQFVKKAVHLGLQMNLSINYVFNHSEATEV
jgi:hypothetical protein